MDSGGFWWILADSGGRLLLPILRGVSLKSTDIYSSRVMKVEEEKEGEEGGGGGRGSGGLCSWLIFDVLLPFAARFVGYVDCVVGAPPSEPFVNCIGSGSN